MSARTDEVFRLADLLIEETMARQDDLRPEEVVRIILDNYQPRVEWTDEMPPADPYNDDTLRRVGGVRYVTARLQVGKQEFKSMGHVMVGSGASRAAMDQFRRHIRLRLGLSIVDWADGRLPEEE